MLGAPLVRGMRVGVGVGEAGAVSRRAVFRCDVCLQEPGGSGSGGAEHLRGKGGSSLTTDVQGDRVSGSL